MTPSVLTLEELAERLGRDRREVEKLADRGRIPGRKRDGRWQFHDSEVTSWLEQELRDYSPEELRQVAETHRSEEIHHEEPLTSLLRPETVAVPLEGRTKRGVLEALMEAAGASYQVWDPARLLQAVTEREELCSTAFPGGVAVPHPRNQLADALGESVVACGVTSKGVPFGAPDGRLTDVFFLVLCRDARTHLHVLARIGRLLHVDGLVDGLREAPDSVAAYDLIHETDDQLG
ncbi:MAG: PTS sugar transporter subunit IIA [Planctomycetota bacterium]